MNKLLLLLIAMFFISSVPLYSQVEVSRGKSEAFGGDVHGVGFSAGPASGFGVSYRYHTSGKFSVQGIVGVFKPKTTDTFYSFGAELQQDLLRSNTTRFFFDVASSYIYNGSDGNNYAAPFRAGVGLGGEFLIQDALHFTLEGLFTYFSDGTILPLPQLAFHYYFY
ncbi:MAG: hypothetical protein PHP42_02145 [Bacteroidota bacterium]|nr:hypothetical protein [Bacteroidota bacterium]